MDILFWSGGKDAYLALQFYRQEQPNTEIRLLTTYDTESDIVPHQEISISHIQQQADSLDLNLIKVPLPTQCPNEIYLQKVGEALENQHSKIEYLIFGDWYLEDIRQWREKVFGAMDYDCLFPIWKKSIHDLLPVLQFAPVNVVINAVREEFRSMIKVGERYDQSFITQLQHLPDINPMGENGEFHTKLCFKKEQDIVQ